MLNPKQREILAGKLMDLGNIALGSLVFGVVVRSEILNRFSVVLGLTFALLAYGYAVSLEKQ